MSVDRPLRIEMVVPSMVRAGMETMVARLSLALTERGHDVGITCVEHEGELAPALRAASIPVTVVPAPGLRTNVRAPALEQWFSQRAPDIVHSHSGAWLKTARAARRVGIARIVHTIHGIEGREPWHVRRLMRLSAAYTDQIVVVSESLRDYLATSCGIAKTRVVTISNGIDLDQFAAAAGERQSAELPADWRGDVIIGHVARLSAVKNQQMLIDAFRLVADQRREVRLVIVGDGPLRDSLEAQVTQLGLGPRVHFAGTTTDVQSWLRLFDLFVLSSDQEGTSMSILEALAAGVCVVATAVGGTPALLDGGRAGRLVPPRDAAGLATALVDLVADPVRRATIARAGQCHAAAEFSHAAMLARYENVYRSGETTLLTPAAEESVCAE